MKPLISVVIPTYKREFEVLKRALSSVLNQSYTKLEVIVVDDFPKKAENNEIKNKILSLKDDRIKYIQHEKNLGACAARNTGISHSSGEYIAFLDDDDEWLADKLELQIRLFDEDEVGLVYTDSYTIIGNEQNGKKNLRSFSINGWVFKKLLKKNYIGSTSFVMIKKEVFDKVGLFDISMKSAQDAEMWLRISQDYKIRHLNKPLVNYYAHEGERITSNADNKIQGMERINAYYEEELSKDKKLQSIRKTKLVPYYLRRDGIVFAFKKWMSAIKIYPFHLQHLSVLKNIIKHYLKYHSK